MFFPVAFYLGWVVGVVPRMAGSGMLFPLLYLPLMLAACAIVVAARRHRPNRPPNASALGGHAVRVVVSLLIAGASVGVSGEVAAADQTGATVPAVSFSARGGLIDVAAATARNAWAVGHAGSICSPRPLILRWNGTAWKRVPAGRPMAAS